MIASNTRRWLALLSLCASLVPWPVWAEANYWRTRNIGLGSVATDAQAYNNACQRDIQAGRGSRCRTINLTSGALVQYVIQGSAYRQAGLQIGDVIVAFNDQEVTSGEQLSELINRTPMQTPLRFEVVRAEQRLNITVASGSATSAAQP